ncbi:MAG TPA: pitrilysin family protein [Steroidobacter sp.]
MKKHAFAAIALWTVWFVSTAVHAQPLSTDEPAPAESISNVELKGKAPVNPGTLRVKLPKPQETTLSNGLRVALIEDHKLPTFALQFVVLSGGLADPQSKRGLAMTTAALLSEGTKKRTSRQIAEQLATLGATFSAGASPSSGESNISVSGLSENAGAILELVADVLLNPSFPADELAKYKARFLSQLEYRRSTPGFLAQEEFMRVLYGEHPASHVVPPENALAAITREDLASFHLKHYRPNNTLLIVYGDLTLKELVKQVERTFGTWQKAEVGSLELPKLTAPEGAQVVLVDRPGSVQTSLWVGTLGIERRSPDYFAVLLMNHILGGGPASRLFLNLREDKGYTYGVSSSFSGSKFPGVMVASTAVRTEVTGPALAEMLAELERIATEPVSAEELKNAKRALIGRFALSLESPQAQISNVATRKIYDLPENYWDTYPQKVDAVTAEDILRVARKYYARERLQIVAVGDGSSVRSVLEKYGKVESPSSRPSAP